MSTRVRAQIGRSADHISIQLGVTRARRIRGPAGGWRWAAKAKVAKEPIEEATLRGWVTERKRAGVSGGGGEDASPGG